VRGKARRSYFTFQFCYKADRIVLYGPLLFAHGLNYVSSREQWPHMVSRPARAGRAAT
jgi:hypothetical protein